ncbi:MAG TPA: hypothetical protein VKV34_00395 [Thermoleophilia bacterium]|nr:hypothetical protein [Thermoleophilia bacterium]
MRIATVAAVAALVVAGLALVVAVTAGSSSPIGVVGSGPDHPQPSAANGCTPDQVHYSPLPGAAQAAGIPPTMPWVTDGRGEITGSLGYLGKPPLRNSTDAVIGTDGRVAHDMGTQIIWWVRGRGAKTLTIVGRRTDSPGSFHETVTGPTAQGANTVFPSIVDVPAAGCWTLEVRSGTSSASLRFQAIELGG